MADAWSLSHHMEKTLLEHQSCSPNNYIHKKQTSTVLNHLDSGACYSIYHNLYILWIIICFLPIPRGGNLWYSSKPRKGFSSFIWQLFSSLILPRNLLLHTGQGLCLSHVCILHSISQIVNSTEKEQNKKLIQRRLSFCLTQWFSTGCECIPRGYLAMSRDVSSYHNWGLLLASSG